MLITGIAQAETVNVSWDAVTERTDGSSILGAVDFMVSIDGALYAETNSTTVQADVNLGSEICVRARETATGLASDPACATLPASKPVPPTINIQIIYDL